jgi:hypothetical protein
MVVLEGLTIGTGGVGSSGSTISAWRGRRMKLSKFKDRKTDSYMLRVSTNEALALISSLAQQVLNKDPNTNRLESYTVNGEYFSISVHPEGDPGLNDD